MRPRFIPLLAAAVVAGALVQPVAMGTTIVPPANLGALAVQSDAVVLATAIENRAAQQGAIVTRTTFAVARVVSGSILAGQLIDLEVPGGEIDGLGLAVPGAPRFVAGGTYLLFLAARPDLTWTPQIMSYGILVESRGADDGRLLQPLEESGDLNALPRPDGTLVERPGTYRELPLLDMLADVAAGRARWDASRALLALPDLHAASVPSGCNLTGYRWHEFDSGGNISIAADDTGDLSLGGDGFTQLQGALSMWRGLSGSTIDTRYGGSVAYSPPCDGQAPKDIVVFNDPCNEMPGLTSCSGVLAYGGAYYSTVQFSTIDGTQYNNATHWFVVVNNGAGCIGSSNYELMMAHELGHGLGFDHITSQPSLMNPACEGTSGCTGFQSIDYTCADYLYPGAPSGPPATPTNVAASDGTYTDRVRVTWSASSGATSYEVFRNTTNNSGGAGSLGTAGGSPFDDYTATPATTYYYWVQASNNLGTSGLGGPDTGYAVVCDDPPTPTASAPPSVLSGDFYSVSWTDTSPDHTYDLQEATNASFSGAVTYSVSGTSRTIKHAVSQNTTYYYRVDAKTYCGSTYHYSPYSGTVSVVVQVSCGNPGVPTLAAPPSATSGVSYLVSWSGTSPDNTYVLQEATDPGFAAPTSYAVTGVSKTFNHTVSAATPYYYRVQATDDCNSTTYTSSYSSTGQTVVNPPCDAPPTPTLTAPASANSGVAYVVSWTATSPTSSYEVQEANNAAFSAATTLSVTGTSQTFSHVVAASATYYYRVRATNACSGTTSYSAYSATKSTVVNPQCDPPGSVALTAPANGSSLTAGATSVTLSWQAATGAGTYDLYFGASASPPLAASGLGANAAVRSVAPGSTYYWKVVAHAACNATLTSTSATWSFFATPPTPPPVASFSVSSGPYVKGVAVQFTDTSTGAPTAWSWTFGDGATSTQRNPSHGYANVGSYVVTLTAANAGGSSQASVTLQVVAAVPTQVVAVVAHTTGLGQSAWRSDVGVTNPGGSAATFALSYKPSGGGVTTTKNLTVQPYATAWLGDVMASFFALGDGRGSLRLAPPAAGPAPAVFSRTYAAAVTGNLGQGIPSLAPLPAGTYLLPGLYHDTAYRTNLGVTAGPASVQVTIDLFRGTTASPVAPSKVFTVGAWDQQQWSLGDLFPGAAQPGVAMTARMIIGGAAVPWASIVDQVSQDSVFRVGVSSASDWFVAVAAHNPGASQTYWRTDVALWNATGTTIAVTAEYLPAGQDNSGGGVTANVAILPPYSSTVVADIAGVNFGVTNGKGALRLSAGGQKFVAASRTYTTRTAGGTLGQGVMAVPTSQVGSTARTLSGIRADGTNRTNIGLATPGAGVNADLTLRDANGAVLATRPGFWVPARSLVQMTFADAFPGAAIPSPVGSVDVVPHGPVAVYLSVLDGSSNDPSLVLAY